ncbi:MAG: hypothetical protein BMS9Abin20_0679 [Acidimicrobiia bacterium]|nr:MAG: hypothetical protein BMS9Abin20_0679 [Acidimicrobiia bacterium]
MDILLATVAAVFFAAGSVTAKRGMQNTSVIAALMIVSGVAAVILGIVVAFDPPHGVTLTAVVLFAVAGLAGDGIGRFSLLGAVDRLGPSTAIPIQTATYPLIAVTGGIVVLSEEVSILQGAGAFTIVAGIWILLGSHMGVPVADDVVEPERKVRRFSVLVLPVIAGVGFAVADLFRKLGLGETPDPAFGALVAVTSMLLMTAVFVGSVPKMRSQIRVGPGWGWLVVAGASIAAALLALFEALDGGSVSVVGPIIAAQPLAVVGLSWALLHNIERVTPRMVAGAALVVVGVVLIAAGT